jgi:hypothetical protein
MLDLGLKGRSILLEAGWKMADVGANTMYAGRESKCTMFLGDQRGRNPAQAQ